MADFNDRAMRSQTSTTDVVDQGLRAYMLRVYNYMLVGLVLTGAAAYFVSSTPGVLELFFQMDERTGRFGLSALGWVAFLAPIAMVFFLSFRIQHMSVGAAQATFWAYALINGIALSPIVLIYTGASVAQAFFITAATFGAMSLWGYTTQRDLTGFGSFLFMGLIGIVIASVVNIFLLSSMMSFVISVIGVLVFTGLTAYDTQWIKNAYAEADDATTAGRKAIIGALKLYLDFINLFLMILRLFGSSRR
ncbi:MAG: Bax inhibitor-1/YccA family protein [Proteobacteria bacterium]|nr:Bax inhibitor-1/YccA family protein [Pseudomonadota bacterium]